MAIHIIVAWMDDTSEAFPVTSHWRCRLKEGIPFLIIGGPPPRVEIPLSNVKFYHVQNWDQDD